VPIFFLLVVLKIPVFGALWLVWWASREPEQEGFEEGSDGGPGRCRPIRPRSRGPHSGPDGGILQRTRDGHGSSSSRTRQAGWATRLRSRRISRR
jgi:hypothetical protein